MKAIYSIIISLFLLTPNSILNAQLVVQDSLNWQQYLSNLMGGACVSISNVSYSGIPASFSLFKDSSGSFGINRGIIMSTGIANPMLQNPAGAFVSQGMGWPGDSMLNNLIGPSFYTYDAVNIEFDFSSPILDTVFIKYVFASEEYPEYVCQNFNDVFGFFVTDSNGNTQNIATIPGTSTPVAINTVNGGASGSGPGCIPTNTMYYIDGNSTNVFVFDGYTVPFTASFVAQPGVVYHLKIAIADAGDAIFDSGVFLEIQDGIQNVVGHVDYLGSPATSGIVELLGYNLDSTISPIVASANLDSNGDFIFNGVPFNSYLLRTTLDPASYPAAVPTYYDSVFIWSEASIINLSCDSLAYDFSPMMMLPMNGSSTISGSIFGGNGAFKTDDVDGPAPDVHVWLKDLNSNQIVAFSKSNASGEYSFTQVPIGNYEVLVDVPVILMSSTHLVSVTSNQTQINNKDYIVLPNEIKIYDNSTVSIEDETFKVSIFPNPAKNYIKVVTNGEQYSIVLKDLSGKVSLETKVNGENRIDISTLPQGLYFVQLENLSGQIVTTKLSIAK